VGIRLIHYYEEKPTGMGIYESMFYIDDWEKDRKKFLKIMHGIQKLADKELEEKEQ